MDVVTDDILRTSAPLSPDVTRVLRAVDAVVITPGDVDAILFLPGATYRRRLEKVLDQMTETAPANMRVFIVATVPLNAVITVPQIIRPLASRLGATLDHSAKRVCKERHNAQFIPFAPAVAAGRGGSGRTYAAWADLIAPSISHQLDSSSGKPIR